jgi:hypothetical protein
MPATSLGTIQRCKGNREFAEDRINYAVIRHYADRPI